MNRTVGARPYGVRARPTWEMSAEELARTWAHHFGFTGNSGGWILDPGGRNVVQGWQLFTALLIARRFILPGRGIDWRTSGEQPRFGRAADNKERARPYLNKTHR